MDPTATVLVVLLMSCLLPVRADPTLRTDVVETTVSPGVTYQLERHWRLAQADVAQQSAWALAEFQNRRDLHPLTWRPEESWIATRLRELRSDAANVWSDHFLKGDLDRFYTSLPSNWHLCDLGLSRNGKPLPLPRELASAIWRDHSRFDAGMRAWNDWYPHDLTDPTAVVSHGFSVAERLDHYVEQAEETLFRAEETLGFGIAAIDAIESVHLHPYLLFVRDGALIGVIGGDGRFDHLPDELEYLR